MRSGGGKPELEHGKRQKSSIVALLMAGLSHVVCGVEAQSPTDMMTIHSRPLHATESPCMWSILACSAPSKPALMQLVSISGRM